MYHNVAELGLIATAPRRGIEGLSFSRRDTARMSSPTPPPIEAPANEEVVWHWWLPPQIEGGRERLSSWAMNEAEAADQGAIRPEPSTRRVRRSP